MCMRILMSMNIYITRENEQKLRQLEGYTMSGIINYLLDNYFKTHNVSEIKEKIEPKAAEIAKQNPEGATIVAGEEQSCCKNRQPCRHWLWDGVKQTYTNSISGRVVEVAQ